MPRRSIGLLFLIALAGSWSLTACSSGYVQEVRSTSEAIRAEASGVPLIPTVTSAFEDTATPTPAAPTVTPSPAFTPTSTQTSTPTFVVTAQALVESGDWWQVYFTDPIGVNEVEGQTSEIAGRLIALIDGATSTIHIASFEFNLTPVAEALIAAHQRGVEVLWVTDDEHGIGADGEEGHGQFALMRNAGIEIRDDQRSGLMHDKFWIFDGQIVWTGSTNITVNGTLLNNNNVIVIDSPQLAAVYEGEFDEMWQGEFGVTSPSTIEAQAAAVDGSQIQVFFGAEDDVASRLVELINQATESIRFMAFSFTHDEMGEAMLGQAQVGVDVSGVFEARGSRTKFSEMTAMFCAGLPVRQDGNPRTLHHKVIIIDDSIVATGSFNFSNNANTSNDENLIVVNHSEIAGLYVEEFNRRFAEAAAPAPGDIVCE